MNQENKCSLTLSEFDKEAKDFLKVSESFLDSWTWETEVNNFEEQGYLRFSQKINDPRNKGIIINAEYHVIYSVAYQVPALYFRLHYADGSLVSLEEAWELFPLLMNDEQLSKDGLTSELNNTRRELLLSTLTQMDHPILFRPFLCLHPCQTAELLAQIPGSKNRILTFISLMGPYVRLTLNPSYGVNVGENNEIINYK